MNDDQHIVPLTARQFLRACTRLFGLRFMYKFFNISERTFCTWRSDKKYVSPDSIRRNYLEQHEELLKVLMEDPDGVEIARALTARHASITGCEIVIKAIISPDKNSIEEECLDDYPPLTRLHSAITLNKDIDAVEFLAGKAKQEIDQTIQLYKSNKMVINGNC
jgi:hypothetical protein